MLKYQPLLLPLLPIDHYISDIEKAMEAHSSLIIVAEPGAGKTTRVPVALSRNGNRWIVLQPRRWATRMSATRIAEEQKYALGQEVGYQVRFENRSSKNTQILFMTEGVFLRRLQSDPELSGFAGVILDEFHERSLDLDLALSLLKELQGSLRPDLKLVIMSATLDPAPLEAFLNSSHTFRVEGRTFPVKKKYLGEIPIASAVKIALQENSSGDILIFLPGAYEIDQAVRDIKTVISNMPTFEDIMALPLYASLPEHEQKKVFSNEGSRKIICSTNIAETSLTLPNVKVVIDSGWAKLMRIDPQFGQERLEVLRISRASSEQRAGRAGWVSEGVCYRLWREEEQGSLRHFETPEIHRVHLGQALLFLSENGVTDFQSFDWYEKPRASMLAFSINELVSLGFLDAQAKGGRITAEGRAALKFPLAPKLAKIMMVSQHEGVPEFGARLAAFLEDRSPMASSTLNHSEAFVRALNSIGGAALLSAKQIFGKQEVPRLRETDWPLFETVMLKALKQAVFCDGKIVGRRDVVGARGVNLPNAGLMLRSLERTEKGAPQIVVQNFVEVAKAQLLKFASKKRRSFYDSNADRVRCLEGLYFEDLELGSVTDIAPTRLEANELLQAFIEGNPEEILSKNEIFYAWLSRVRFFNRMRKNEAIIVLNWEEWLPMICDGKTRLNQIIEAPIVSLIEGAIESRLVHEFDEWAPQILEVPSGSKIKLDYSSDQPKLSVRLQELFGWTEAPQIAKGRVPLLIELLSPSFKPIQVTQDLKSFWSNAYFEVKKELKARYPKHSWPDDPLVAKPEAKGRRRY